MGHRDGRQEKHEGGAALVAGGAARNEGKREGEAFEKPAQEDAFAKLEKLGKLRASGVITEAEFGAKKKSLLDSI